MSKKFGFEAVILTGTMVQLHWSQWKGVLCWINVFENNLTSISRPTLENVYLDKNILILGGLEAEIC